MHPRIEFLQHETDRMAPQVRIWATRCDQAAFDACYERTGGTVEDAQRLITSIAASCRRRQLAFHFTNDMIEPDSRAEYRSPALVALYRKRGYVPADAQAGIFIKTTYTPQTRATLAAHEFCHSVDSEIQGGYTWSDWRTGRAYQIEASTEIAAYLLNGDHGIDSLPHSAVYIAHCTKLAEQGRAGTSEACWQAGLDLYQRARTELLEVAA